jgi:hypothetical protein
MRDCLETRRCLSSIGGQGDPTSLNLGRNRRLELKRPAQPQRMDITVIASVGL